VGKYIAISLYVQQEKKKYSMDQEVQMNEEMPLQLIQQYHILTPFGRMWLEESMLLDLYPL
jgi:Spy/CpxP family protein refolding chaperone